MELRRRDPQIMIVIRGIMVVIPRSWSCSRKNTFFRPNSLVLRSKAVFLCSILIFALATFPFSIVVPV